MTFKEILEEAYLIFRVALVVSFLNIFAFSLSRKSSKRYLILTLSSLGILLLFGVIALFDNYIIPKSIDNNYRLKLYIYFLAVAFIYFVVFLVLLLTHLSSFRFEKSIKKEKKKVIYTVHEKNEYLYYFFSYLNDIYVLDETLTGKKYRLRRDEFSDDALNKILDYYNLDNAIANRHGILTVKGEKRDDVYYCYMIELTEDREFSDLIKISKYDFTSRDVNRIDKYIIIKCLSSANFDETL